MRRADLLRWLREDREQALEPLWAEADATRREAVGDAVHLRGLIEVSSHCSRGCTYCGLRSANRCLTRYRMSTDEVLAAAKLAQDFGYGTVVLQAGEDPELSDEWVEQLCRALTAQTDLAVTLSLGERSPAALERFRRAGASRYLLRFETSDAALLRRIHPPRRPGEPAGLRLELLRQAAQLGFEVGSGVMVGLPGQTYDTLADDLTLLSELDLHMVGVGPYIAHPATPLGRETATPAGQRDQVPATEQMAHKVLALTRLCCPDANVPVTTAVATVDPQRGRLLGLARGANVIMPNVTPLRYRRLYQIYPSKASSLETAEQTRAAVLATLAAAGRTVGQGPGGSSRPRRMHS